MWLCAWAGRALPGRNAPHFPLHQAPVWDGSRAGLCCPPPCCWPRPWSFPSSWGEDGGQEEVHGDPHQAAVSSTTSGVCLMCCTTLLRWAPWAKPVFPSASSSQSVTVQGAVLASSLCSSMLSHSLTHPALMLVLPVLLKILQGDLSSTSRQEWKLNACTASLTKRWLKH